MRIRQLTVAAGAALLLTACGGSPLDGKTGPEVATAAADALEKAGAVHVAGTMSVAGEDSQIDLHLQGGDATGSITMGGAELQLISVDGAVYMKTSPEFWTNMGLPAEAGAMFDGKWIAVPPAQAAEFEEFSLAGIAGELRNPSDGEIKDEVTSDEVDGKSVVVVEQEDGSTVKVADDEPSYPLEMTGTGDSEGKLTFSRFGEKEDITAPADAMDPAELMGGA